MQRWYLIHTKPSCEWVARSNLVRQGYEVYFPRFLRPLRRRARWTETIVALFPRYLFLRLNEGHQPFAPVCSTVGVANVVRFGSRYAVVPDHIVNDLRSRADPLSGLHCLNANSQLAAGARVRITMGPFSGLHGVFQRQAGADRVVVLLNLLGQDAPVRVPSGFVLPSLAV